MLIKFDDELVKYTSFNREIDIEGCTVSDCLLNTFDKFPQLYAFLVCNNSAEADKTTFVLNGEYITEGTALWSQVTSEDVLELRRDVPEGANAMGRILAGAAILALAIWNPPMAGAAGATLFGTSAMSVGMFGAAMMLGGASELLVGKPNLPSDGNSQSNTYTFSGIKNSTVAGTPIPAIYGRHKTGGHVLNAYVDLPASQGNSFLYAQLGVSEGEIDSIDYNSIEINNRNARDFEDVSAFWRPGSTAPNSGVNWTLFSPKTSTNKINDQVSLTWTLTTTERTVPDPVEVRINPNNTDPYSNGEKRGN